MGFFGRFKAALKGNWCVDCQVPYELEGQQLYMLPQSVGHYTEHKDAEYYMKNLRKVEKKADIPTGTYACGAVRFHCPECGKHIVQLRPFLPVRDQEKEEATIDFEHGELDEFLRR